MGLVALPLFIGFAGAVKALAPVVGTLVGVGLVVASCAGPDPRGRR